MNPTPGTYNIKMKTIKLANRVRTEINSKEYSFPSLTSIIPGKFPLSHLVLILLGPFSSPGSYVLSSLLVSTTTSITFTPRIRTASITNVINLLIELPTYDLGWISSTAQITCKIGSVVYACIGYTGADWVSISFSSTTTFFDGTIITISNLRVPRYSDVNIGGIKVRFVNTANRYSEYSVMGVLPTATVPTFDQATMIVDKKNKGAVNVAYTFVFVSQNDIPQDASIIISFPTGYNLLSSSPVVTFSSPDLLPATGQKVSFSASIESLTVSGFKTIAAFNSFTIVVEGVKNPTNLAQSAPWRAQVFLNSGLMVYHNNFDQFAFTPLLTASSITYNSIQAVPLNAGEEASYILNFVPSNQIPVGGQILITFPTANYDSLPSPPTCRISGGVTTFASCSLSGKALKNTFLNIFSLSFCLFYMLSLLLLPLFILDRHNLYYCNGQSIHNRRPHYPNRQHQKPR